MYSGWDITQIKSDCGAGIYLFLLFPPATEDVCKQVVIETYGNKKKGMGM